MNSKAPILLFTYNRLKHTIATVENLQRNVHAAASELYIFSDGAPNAVAQMKVNEVRKYLKTIIGFKQVHIIEREGNYGLSKNIIDGVTEIVNNYGKVIVLEDDLLTSPYFLKYMNEALDKYDGNKEVISIHGYVFPVKKELPETFFLKGADCFGWATWKDGWNNFEKDGSLLLDRINASQLSIEFDFNGAYPYTQMLKDQIEGRNDSWAIRWYASAFLKGMLTMYPGRSLVFHNGGDGSGTNAGFDSLLDVELADSPIAIKNIEVIQNQQVWNTYSKFLRKLANPGILYRIKRKFKGFRR